MNFTAPVLIAEYLTMPTITTRDAIIDHHQDMLKQIRRGLIDLDQPYPKGWCLELNTEFEMLDNFIDNVIFNKLEEEWETENLLQ